MEPIPLSTRFTEGQHIRGRVAQRRDFGLFVDIGEGQLGLIYITHFCHPIRRRPWSHGDMPAVGEFIDVWVLHVDDKRQRIILDLKDPNRPFRIELVPIVDDTHACTVAMAEQSCQLTITWLAEMMAKLLNAALAVLHDASHIAIGYASGDGGQRWILARNSPQFYTLSILGFDSPQSHLPDIAGTLLFSAVITPHDFLFAVRQAAGELKLASSADTSDHRELHWRRSLSADIERLGQHMARGHW